GLQTASDGLRLLPTGRNTDLPWSGINQVLITFNQNTALSPADITVKGLKGVNYGPVTISSRSIAGSALYEVFIITLARPITVADRLTITIAGATFATFTRRIDVLPGDFNDDGAVKKTDVTGIRGEMLQGAGGTRPTLFGEILGD